MIFEVINTIPYNSSLALPSHDISSHYIHRGLNTLHFILIELVAPEMDAVGNSI